MAKKEILMLDNENIIDKTCSSQLFLKTKYLLSLRLKKTLNISNINQKGTTEQETNSKTSGQEKDYKKNQSFFSFLNLKQLIKRGLRYGQHLTGEIY